MSQVIIRPERPQEQTAIRAVNDHAFGQTDEGRLVDALREGGYARVSLVAVGDGEVIGHILFSQIEIVTEEKPFEALSLAPMAVLPTRQRQGVGSALVNAGLTRCRDLGEQIAIVLGHPEYYPRFGFSSELAANLESPFTVPPQAWMALELSPGSLDGIRGRVKYPPPFTQA